MTTYPGEAEYEAKEKMAPLPRDRRPLSEREILVCQIAGAVAGSFMASRFMEAHDELVEQSVEIARLIVAEVENG